MKKTKKKIKKTQPLMSEISNIKKDHPNWGYRKVWASLKAKKETNISQKAVYRVMKEKSLLCPKEAYFDLPLQGKKSLKLYVTISSKI